MSSIADIMQECAENLSFLFQDHLRDARQVAENLEKENQELMVRVQDMQNEMMEIKRQNRQLQEQVCQEDHKCVIA